MAFPAFFDLVPRITLRDPLAEFLGAAEGGLIEYSYTDAVRLAGHSCPTVAGAYLLTCRALSLLYPESTPERGGIAVAIGSSLDVGVAGVISGVVTLLTGAAGIGGFKGLGGRFSRQNLLQYGAGGHGTLQFRRLDNSLGVRLHLDLSSIPADPEMSGLLNLRLVGRGDKAQQNRFAELWQDCVRRLLLEHWDDPKVVICATD